jgi:hypothetical protein
MFMQENCATGGERQKRRQTRLNFKVFFSLQITPAFFELEATMTS